MLVIPVILLVASLADAACDNTYPIYYPISGFPQGSTTTTVCYDTTYYRSADIGQAALQGSSDRSFAVQSRCQASCNSDPKCKAIIGTTQYAADSNAATGVCYFYDHTPSPRKCSDASKRAIRAETKGVCPTGTTTTASPTPTPCGPNVPATYQQEECRPYYNGFQCCADCSTACKETVTSCYQACSEKACYDAGGTSYFITGTCKTYTRDCSVCVNPLAKRFAIPLSELEGTVVEDYDGRKVVRRGNPQLQM